MPIATIVRPSFYQDSVALLALAREIRALPGVTEAAALMATPANRALLAQASLLTAESGAAGANDLVIAIDATTAGAAETARARAEALLDETRARRTQRAGHSPRTIDGALRRMPDADLALISVPGAWAAAEARRALDRGLHAMIWSDNVSIEDEIALKRRAVERRLLVMGPDCGTAYLGGVPLGFANLVPRGRVGLVAASGTGLQQVATLLASCGEGIAQAIGVGGRDTSAEVGGLMTLAALDALGEDPATEVIVVIGKPGAPAVRDAVEATLRRIGKSAVIALLGCDVQTGHAEGVTTVATLEDAAAAAVDGPAFTPRTFSDPDDVRRRVTAARSALGPRATAIRGLYAGGTLGHESALILGHWLGPIDSRIGDARLCVVDLGADEHTVSRAHPMLDPTLRIEAISRAAKEDAVGVLLLDVVLGLGAAADPAGDVAPAIEAARAEATASGRHLAVVASVIGTADDPQNLDAQIARLERAGVWVLPSNAQAARAAACIADPSRATVDRMLERAR